MKQPTVAVEEILVKGSDVWATNVRRIDQRSDVPTRARVCKAAWLHGEENPL